MKMMMRRAFLAVIGAIAPLVVFLRRRDLPNEFSRHFVLSSHEAMCCARKWLGTVNATRFLGYPRKSLLIVDMHGERVQGTRDKWWLKLTWKRLPVGEHAPWYQACDITSGER